MVDGPARAAAVAIFLLVYGIILAGERSPRKLDRPAAGLVGAVLMVVCGVMTRAQALAAIDFGTLALLFGMMVVIYYATGSRLLEWLAHRIVGGRQSPRRLLWTVGLAAGILSAFFVNDTICLLMTPLVLSVARRKGIGAEPYLLALATGSNVGSVMTLTGNPQNMLIGQSSHWTWAAYALRMAPLGLICLLVNCAIVARLFRDQMQTDTGATADPATAPPKVDWKLARKTLVVLAGLLAGFLAGAPMDVVALSAAVVLIVLANRPPQETFAAVDWSLLLFFAGLFVVVGGVSQTEGGLIARMLPLFTHHTARLAGLAKFSAFSVVGSNLFSNVPFVMLLREWISRAPHAPLLWLALAASSTFAGNLTLVGSVANLIVAQGARDECPLSFLSFLRVGGISAVVTTGVAVVILWLYHAAGWV